MIQNLVIHTNRAISATRALTPAAILNSDKKCHFVDTNEVEIRGLIGLMYYRGMINQGMEKIDHLSNQKRNQKFNAQISQGSNTA